jgi:hypothetical protein
MTKEVSNATLAIVAEAMRTNPELFDYIRSLDESSPALSRSLIERDLMGAYKVIWGQKEGDKHIVTKVMRVYDRKYFKVGDVVPRGFISEMEVATDEIGELLIIRVKKDANSGSFLSTDITRVDAD